MNNTLLRFKTQMKINDEIKFYHSNLSVLLNALHNSQKLSVEYKQFPTGKLDPEQYQQVCA